MKIPKAEDFIDQHYNESWRTEDFMIEFAKLHVKAALKAAANQEERVGRCEFIVLNESQKNLVMNAYPDELIK